MRRAEIGEWHLAAQAPEAPDDYAETLAEELRQNELLAAHKKPSREERYF